MDHLSTLVDLVDAQCTLSGALIAKSDGVWGAELPTPKSLKLLVVRTDSWFRADGQKPFLAKDGDIVVVQSGRTFFMGNSPSCALGGDVIVAKDSDLSAEVYTDPDCVALACHVTLNSERARTLLAALPDHIVVSGSGHEAKFLRALYEQLVNELRAGAAGSKLAVQRLTQLILLQVLRAHSTQLAQECAVPVLEWVSGLGDDGLSKALHAMHKDPARRWTVEELAAIASMSRTRFAESFRKEMNDAPLTYLRNMRMAIAVQELTNGSLMVATIGRKLGYDSESAFSAAFKKTMNMSPKRYRDQVSVKA